MFSNWCSLMFYAKHDKWHLRDFLGSTTNSVDHNGTEPGRKPRVKIAGHCDRDKRVTGGQEPPSHSEHLTFFRWWWTRSIEKRKVRIEYGTLDRSPNVGSALTGQISRLKSEWLLNKGRATNISEAQETSQSCSLASFFISTPSTYNRNTQPG